MRKTIPILFAVALLGTTAFLSTTGINSKKVDNTTPVSSVQAANTASTKMAQMASSSGLKDGTYSGAVSPNAYEDVAVIITVSGGQIKSTSMNVSNMGEGKSSRIVSRAEKSLNNQAISAQSAHIDGVSGATSTSESYAQSLQSAIDKAKQS